MKDDQREMLIKAFDEMVLVYHQLIETDIKEAKKLEAIISKMEALLWQRVY